jgi:N-hydroxyarylamine O-acetyltransferase
MPASNPTPDLDAYFARIGYDGAPTSTHETLCALHARHARAIPFENLDVLLERGIRLDLASIEQKLVRDRRGGYCFEQNGLFIAVLRALGFAVTPLIGRVRWQVPADVPAPATHMVIRVDLDGRPWLADVGFGGTGLIAPLALDTDAAQGPAAEPRRLFRDGRHLVHQIGFGGAWHDVYRFTLDEALPIDFEVANWFTSAHPNSRFRNNLIVSRVDGARRLAVFNAEFIVRHADGSAQKTPVGSPDDLLALLREEFGLEFPPGTRFGHPPAVWPV